MAASCLLYSSLASLHGFHCTHGPEVYFCDPTFPSPSMSLLSLCLALCLSVCLPMDISTLVSQNHVKFTIYQMHSLCSPTKFTFFLLFLLLNTIDHGFINYSPHCLTFLPHNTHQMGYEFSLLNPSPLASAPLTLVKALIICHLNATLSFCHWFLLLHPK